MIHHHHEPVYAFPLFWFHPLTPAVLYRLFPGNQSGLLRTQLLKFSGISSTRSNDLIYAGTRSPLACPQPMCEEPFLLTSALSRWVLHSLCHHPSSHVTICHHNVIICHLMSPSAFCLFKVDFPCQPGKYRAYNGYCNNVQNPNWGVANRR